MESELTSKIEVLRQAFEDKLIERRATMAAGVEDISEAVDAATREKALLNLENIAHQISGSGAIFGHKELGIAAEALELACRQSRDDPTSSKAAENLMTCWNGVVGLIDGDGTA